MPKRMEINHPPGGVLLVIGPGRRLLDRPAFPVNRDRLLVFVQWHAFGQAGDDQVVVKLTQQPVGDPDCFRTIRPWMPYAVQAEYPLCAFL